MKDLKLEMANMFVGIGCHLVQVIGSQAFEFWQRKDFRLYVDFDNLSQTEQDRMFNELEVSIIGLFILHLDFAKNQVDKPFQSVLRILQKEIATGFVDYLISLGVDEKHRKEWNMLISMRLEEYREHITISLSESKKMKEFKKESDDSLRNAWARIETITIDCLSHIRRGDVKEGDPLWKLLRKWFVTIDGTYMNPIADLALKS